jgi:hypothetical protein
MGTGLSALLATVAAGNSPSARLGDWRILRYGNSPRRALTVRRVGVGGDTVGGHVAAWVAAARLSHSIPAGLRITAERVP